MAKSADAFRTISEVAEWLDTPAHVLRFWESKFTQVKPVKRAGGRRYYRPQDMKLLGGIKRLLHDDGMTIKSVQRLLREQGVKHVVDMSQPLAGEDPRPITPPMPEPEPVAPDPGPVVGFRTPPAEEPPEAEAPAPVEPPPPAPEPEWVPPAPEAVSDDPAPAPEIEEEEASAPAAEPEPEVVPEETDATEETDAQDDSPPEPEEPEAPRLPAFLSRAAHETREDAPPQTIDLDPEPVLEAEPIEEPEPAEEPEPVVAFVHENRADTEPESAPAPAPLVADVPDQDPGDADFAHPGILSQISGLSRPLDTDFAEEIGPALRRLRDTLDGADEG